MRKGLAVAFALVVVAIGGAFALRPSPRAEHESLLADLRARGVPVTMAEADPPLPPPEENGARDLDLARAWWEEHEPEGEWHEQVAGPWTMTVRWPWWETCSPEQLRELDTFLVSLAPLFEHVDRAVDRREIGWPAPSWESAADYVDDPVPGEIPWLQELSKFLNARAIAGATAEERCEGVRAQLALGMRYRARRILGQLVARVLTHAAVLDLRRALEGATIDPDHARDRLDALLAECDRRRLPDLVRYERAHMLDLTPWWLDGSVPDELEKRRAKGPPPGFEKRLERWVEEFVKGKKEPDARAWIEWVRTLELYADAARVDGQIPEMLHVGGRPFNGTTVVLDRLRTFWVDDAAAARLARLALAAYAFRSDQGAWPQTAADLAPYFPEDVPVDPYTGDAFLLGRDGEHLLLRAQRWQHLHRDEEEPRSPGDDWRLPPR